MNILIVEDEDLAVKKIQKTLLSVEGAANVVGVTDSIRSTVEWLQQNDTPDLILMDIELADGQSFEIFKLTEIKSPVIFTTSYDEYALKAFKVNSIDYLLKPVQKEELQAALDKYKQMKKSYGPKEGEMEEVRLDSLLKELRSRLEKLEKAVGQTGDATPRTPASGDDAASTAAKDAEDELSRGASFEPRRTHDALCWLLNPFESAM